MPDLSINQSSDSNTVHQEVSPQVINAVWNQFQEKLTTGNDVAAQVGIKRDPEKIAAAVAEEESARKIFGRRTTDVPGDTVGRRDGDAVVTGEVQDSSFRVLLQS